MTVSTTPMTMMTLAYDHLNEKYIHLFMEFDQCTFRMRWQSHSNIVSKLENFFSWEALNSLTILSIYLFRM